MSRDRALMPGAISVARILQVGPIVRVGSACESMVNSVCNSEVRRHIDTPMSTLSAHANRRCALVGSMTGLIGFSPEAAFVRSRYPLREYGESVSETRR